MAVVIQTLASAGLWVDSQHDTRKDLRSYGR